MTSYLKNKVKIFNPIRFSLNNEKEKEIFRNYETFLSKSHFFYTTNFDEPEVNIWDQRLDVQRLYILALLKLCCTVFTIRCLVDALWPTLLVKNLTCDAIHLLGNSVLINLALVLLCFASDLHAGMHGYFNVFGQARMFAYMHKVKFNKFEHQLSDRFSRKFYRRLNIISKIIDRIFLANVFTFWVITCIPTIMGYFEPNLDFPIIGNIILFTIERIIVVKFIFKLNVKPLFQHYLFPLINVLNLYIYLGIIFWSLIILVWAWNFWAMMLAGGSFWCLSLINLKYHFTYLDRELRQANNKSQTNKIMEVLHYHKQMEMETYKLNQEFKYHLSYIYKFVKLVLNMCIFCSHFTANQILIRCLTAAAAAIMAFLIYTISYLSSSVMSAAHRPQSALYSCLMSRTQTLPLKMKLKFMRFIERLSGHEIGFYCLDLFPINSYNFADYLFDSAYSYLLVIKMLKRNAII